MTPEKKRVAIATACGWKCAGHPQQLEATEGYNFAYQFVINPNGELVTHNSIPDYLSDLNAMHEAKKMLTDDQRWEQVKIIVDYRQAENGFPLLKRSEALRLHSATAEEEAEAFLRTLGLWEEAQ